MKSASTKLFLKLRLQLESERTEIIARLRQVDAALGSFQEAAPAPARKSAKPGPRRKRARNEMSLKDAVLKVTSAKALTKQEIVTAVGKLGYVFTTKTPQNSLGVILYGKSPKFKNLDGKFSAA